MKKHFFLFSLLFVFAGQHAWACEGCKKYNDADFQVSSATITHHKSLGVLVWEIQVKGQAGKTQPKAIGRLNGAPVLGYVFPTTLKATDVGFSQTEGMVAMALTSHPDFDDTPLWDENNDNRYDNDGLLWHAHWVLLVDDKRVPGGQSVKEHKKGDSSVRKPKTAPDMPMYMDSPNFNIVTEGNAIRVVIPTSRINEQTTFSFDAVGAYMEVSTGEKGGHEGGAKPMLGVYKIYSVLSGNLSLPYKVKTI
jgi:hypothetical protein